MGGHLAYAVGPMADEDWLKAYEKELKENEKLERMLKKIRSNTPVIGHTLDELASPADVKHQTWT